MILITSAAVTIIKLGNYFSQTYSDFQALMAILFALYSCFEKGCLTKGEKRTRQCRKLLWVMVIFIVVWANLTVFHREEGNGTNTCVRFSSFLVAESSWTSIKQSQTLITHNANRHCRVRFYTFLGQPLSKQLYIPALLVVKFSIQYWQEELTNNKEYNIAAGKVHISHKI